MTRVVLFLLIVSSLPAQVRYQFSDDTRRADPKFDDSAWPVLAPGLLPLPGHGSDGFLWIRFRVPVPPDTSPLAVRLAREDADAIPDEVWVNGFRVGSHGRFPPNPEVRTRYSSVVFDLPAGLVRPGDTALVAWRAWVPPGYTLGLPFVAERTFEAAIGNRAWMRAEESNARASVRFANGLDNFLAASETLLGLALLLLWFGARGEPVLLWFSLFVLSWGLGGLFDAGNLDAPAWVYWTIWSTLAQLINVGIIQFLRSAFDVPRWTALWLLVIGAIWPLFWVLGAFVMTPHPAVAVLARLGPALFAAWLAAIMLIALWVVVRGRPGTRGLAAAFGGWGASHLFGTALGAVLPFSIEAGGYESRTENLATVVLIFVMCGLLLRRLWIEWKAREELRGELEAARVMQARLVPDARDVPGFRIESAYYPARQVGGDFFRIVPGEGGSVLIIVGDVSGKGMGAAMTVAAIAGALDNEFSRRPAEVLEHLNRALRARRGEGFVTCCAVLIGRTGEVVAANAGHLAPYVELAEMALETGLPLGVLDDVTYSDVASHIAGEQALTFVTDGVVEAARGNGELFGFDRTRAISGNPADEIASAARAWGQTDDITVVTVRRTA